MSENIEMSIRAEAADCKLTIFWVGGNCQVTVSDTSGLPVDGPITISKLLTPDQAAATIALFVGEFSDPETNRRMYEIAEPVWADVPQNLRPIP